MKQAVCTIRPFNPTCHITEWTFTHTMIIFFQVSLFFLPQLLHNQAQYLRTDDYPPNSISRGCYDICQILTKPLLTIIVRGQKNRLVTCRSLVRLPDRHLQESLGSEPERLPSEREATPRMLHCHYRSRLWQCECT